VPPYLSTRAALEEIAWAKERGACGVMKRGTEQNRPASDPYFFPIYEAVSDLDLPICMHAGSGDPTATSPVNPRLHAISACLDLVGAGIPEKFPELRTGWIECGASWIPYVWQDIVARQRAQSWGSSIRKIAGRVGIEVGPDLFRRFRFYSSCESTDDLDYILGYGTEDSLLLGTDYGHSDQSAEMRVHHVIDERVAAGALSADVARKLLGGNARRFYAL
jgi:predicted TIM-barrel fold metal-dependent hydrolase